MSQPVFERTDHIEPENWLTYHGDQTRLVGTLMGPGYGPTLAETMFTVIAARYEPNFIWEDRPPERNGIGRTQLGLVTGDVRGEMSHQIQTINEDGVVMISVAMRS
jgi:hypothetical protein